MTLKVLVTGGGGYIGSHMIKMLACNGHQVVTYDDLSTGFRDAISAGEFIYGSLLNLSQLKEVFTNNKFDAVIHFAGSIAVGESVLNPEKYYQNNVVGSLNLINTMKAHKVDKLVFSSTAAIFGNPEYVPIDELHPKNPINPYGVTKLFIEQVLADYDRAYNFRSVSLRYFNAAGADPDGSLGERHEPETHLIPLALRATNSGQLKVFGIDYPTHDGTCVRDYIHVLDLCRAHMLSLDYLISFGKSSVYNLGNGKGYSVNEIIKAIERVTSKKVMVQYCDRRDGDPPTLIADSKNIYLDLGWVPEFKKIDEIIEHAWNWERKSFEV